MSAAGIGPGGGVVTVRDPLTEIHGCGVCGDLLWIEPGSTCLVCLAYEQRGLGQGGMFTLTEDLVLAQAAKVAGASVAS